VNGLPDFEVPVTGGALGGWVTGSGTPLLLLHGGPGLSDYTEAFADELGTACTVYRYQQRGLAPSLTTGPFDIDTHVRDAIAVLDAHQLDRVWLVGHSWGGHLALYLACRHPERFLGVVSVDPLGAVGDGGEQDLAENRGARHPPAARQRMELLDQRALAGEGTAADAVEGLRLAWPGYFADPSTASPMPDLDLSVEGYAQTFEDIRHHLEHQTLVDELPHVTLPVTFILGRQSPIPLVHGQRTAALIPGAVVHELDACGHMVWMERPGTTVEILKARASWRTGQSVPGDP
jgi:proline iminopeptidase